MIDIRVGYRYRTDTENRRNTEGLIPNHTENTVPKILDTDFIPNYEYCTSVVMASWFNFMLAFVLGRVRSQQAELFYKFDIFLSLSVLVVPFFA